jgi:hypothetical protein
VSAELPDYPIAPLALFAFNRLDLARSLISTLEQNPEWRRSPVHVFIDGPRNADEAVKTDSVREYFESIDHPDLTIVARLRNIGLKASLSSGISEVARKYDRVIVLEDDLQLSPDALRYFNTALDAYRNDMRVWSICGDIPDLRGFGREAAHFMPVGSSWGWATWSNRWAKFSDTCEISEQARKSRVFRERFNVHGLRRFDRMLKMAEIGRISSWYVHWQLTIVRNNGLSLLPPVPMVRNSGFGGGTHSSRFSLPNFFRLGDKKLGSMDFSLPPDVEIDFEFTQKVIDSTEWRLLRLNSYAGQLRRQLRDLLKRPAAQR